MSLVARVKVPENRPHILSASTRDAGGLHGGLVCLMPRLVWSNAGMSISVKWASTPIFINISQGNVCGCLWSLVEFQDRDGGVFFNKRHLAGFG